MEEDTRVNIIGALWQYIKSNRLQDNENREIVNCNQELMGLFELEKISFHEIVDQLKNFLEEADPLQIDYDIVVGEASPRVFEVQVEVDSEIYRKYAQFLLENNYESYSGPLPSERMAVKSSILKKREAKLNAKSSELIQKMSQSYRRFQFFSELYNDLGKTLNNTLIGQGRLLRVVLDG